MKNNNIKNRCGGKRGCSITDYTIPYGKHNSDIICGNFFVYRYGDGRWNDIREVQNKTRRTLREVA